ncbi:MAG: energy transducer TonB [Candidatus Cloacimonetes bacterium]|nr:energy transducer TonB [Candidatus Cloacimonadota bacterium]
MKTLMCFIIVSIILACSSNHSSKQDLHNKITPTDKSNQDFGKTSRFGEFEVAPYPIKQVPPIYPPFALKAGIEGQVMLEVEVFADGTVGAVNVIRSVMSGPGGLDEAAVNSVKKWIFQPAMSAGKPVACWITYPVEFDLNSRK